MSRGVKFALIGCGGLIVLLVLVGGCFALVVGSGGGDSGSPSEDEAQTVAIGQPLPVGSVQWTVTDARRVSELTQQDAPPKVAKTEQGDFVVVDFSFTNNDSDAVTLDNNSLVLLDSQERESKSSPDEIFYVPKERKVFLERINPGVSREGQAIFQVAPGASGFRLQAGDARPITNEEGYVDLGF